MNVNEKPSAVWTKPIAAAVALSPGSIRAFLDALINRTDDDVAHALAAARYLLSGGDPRDQTIDYLEEIARVCDHRARREMDEETRDVLKATDVLLSSAVYALKRRSPFPF